MIFDLKDNVPIISVEGVHIPEFKAIWESDDDPDKLKASGALAYVYHVSDYESSYAKLPQKDRELEVRQDYIIDDWFPTELIEAAILKYKRLTETEEVRLIQSALNACAKVREYFDDIDFKDRDAQGKPVYTIREVMNALKEIGKTRASLEDLEEMVVRKRKKQRQIKKNVVPSEILDD